MRRPALALLLGCLLLVAGVSALDGYDYYQTIGYAACDQETYQQDIVVHRTTGTAYEEVVGSLRIWHIYVGDHCREDYGDVRFTTSAGAELAYYLWPDYSSESARFCVRLEGADQSGALTVWYGNPTATTASDGSATYLLFDHFDGAVNAAPNPDLWEVVKKGSSSATVKLDGNGNLLLAGAPNTISSGNVWAKPLLSRNVIIEYRDKISDKNYPDTSYGKGGVSGVFDAGSNTWWHTGLYSAYAAWVQDGTQATSCALQRTNPATEGSTETVAKATSAFYPSLNTFYTHRFEVQSANLKFYRDDVLIASGSDTTYSGDDFRLLFSQGEYSTGDGGTRTIDYVLIRAYSATPPAAITFSGEQETAAPPVTAFTATPTAGLAPLTVQFTDLSGGRPTSWHWDFGDGTSSTEQNPTHTYASPGLYTVTLIATNEYGSDEETKTDYITVYGPVTAQFTANITSGIAPLTVQFTDLSTGGPTSWHWDFGDGNTSTAQNPQHTYTTAGLYTVTLTASHPYDSDTETKTAYITVAVLQPFPGLTLIPRDLTGNGLYTDINGNNRLDYNDLTVFFQNLAWAKTAQPTSCFDFNGNNRLDYNDVITLFSIIMEEHT